MQNPFPDTVPVIIDTEILSGNILLEMIKVEGGSFIMGNNESDRSLKNLNIPFRLLSII